MNFMKKPANGWLHEDENVRNVGVIYVVQYIGQIEVMASMKALDVATRSLVAKECIYRVCEATGLQPVDSKRKVDKLVQRALGNQHPQIGNGNQSAQLKIKSDYITLRKVSNNEILAMHEMPQISFASGGDQDTADYIAYVAKDKRNVRSCIVIECGNRIAQDVITTIGQAFDIRYRDFCKDDGDDNNEADREYYNDLPGKVPPDIIAICSYTQRSNRPRLPSNNLIDLTSELPPPVHHDYVNETYTNRHDVFDVTTNSLENELWFHGAMTRGTAETLLINDGDFLVRESLASPGQYILSGLQDGSKKHLLLIDPSGCVRTKDRQFDSVSHLIYYHFNQNLPIISSESALYLRNAVQRRQP